METIMLSEQDIINALCLHLANKKEVAPEDVEVELLFDDDYGFSAEAYVGGRKQVLIEANIIEALRFYLDTQMNIDPVSAGLELVLDDEEGIVANVRAR
ncbi:YxcD family protein [Fictibacillus enclensis]|uniref:YxcD family protein n=1 Tax=Fictibacillus enclensis TaxID=1017270 RepID=UPI0025A2A745|nr:YxcD family protein [Fictibacillus enclensis]MDM5197340.1 YxcD family protein [Fictibacillus enclensis]